MKLRLIAGMLLLVHVTPSFSQIKDPEQRKSWFYLQQLATEIKQLENCAIDAVMTGKEVEADKVFSVSYRKQAELVHEIETYAHKYVSTRGERETPEVFLYRIWSVALEAGTNNAKLESKYDCSGLLLE